MNADNADGYCGYCNKVVPAHRETSAGRTVALLNHRVSQQATDYGTPTLAVCRGSGKIVSAEIPLGEVKKFAFKVRPERKCSQVGDHIVHRAHEYRIVQTYWCEGYQPLV